MYKLMFLTLTIVLAVGSNTSADSQSDVKQRMTIEGFVERNNRFFLGCERPAVSFSFCMLGSGFNAGMRIQLRSGNRKILVSGFKDLKGFVHIVSKAQALKYVRLKTSPLTYTLWSDDHNEEVEVVSESQFGQLPNYGYRYSDDSGRLVPSMPMESYHTLTDSRYKKLSFSPPKVSFDGCRYIIERWVYDRPKWHGDVKEITVMARPIQKLREIVAPDGGYFRVVLSDRPDFSS